MARTSDARERALSTAERLVREQGAAATGLAQIIAESGAPKGSFYFHFPGGKEQLLLEMLDRYATAVAAGIARLDAAVGGNAADFADALFKAMADDMARDDFARGCALQALTDEYASTQSPIASALRQHNNAWLSAVAKALVARGIDTTAVDHLALWLVTTAQGGRSMARIAKSAAPFDAIRSSIPAVFGSRER